ncbi:MAG: M23 family metallopeptidase [Caldilineaceae bacterium]|nr:M23 family metallopeptidase [Caldilineaceae bacterium]
MSSEHDHAPSESSTPSLIHLECRPQRLIAARYDDMPFPQNGPMQEVALDIGVTAKSVEVLLAGMVVRGYEGHQMLFEQRWPARVIQQRIGSEDLTIQPGTGIALRGLHFLLHGYANLSHVEVTVVVKPTGDLEAEADATQAMLQIPVEYPTQQTELHFPLRGSWWVIQGSDWSDRHKTEVFSQTYAMDLVKLGPENNFFRGAGLELTDHYSWDQPIYATAGGKIAFVAYDMPDIMPGTVPDPRMFRDDPRRMLGNAVVISHANGEFSFYGHLQQASLEVNQGEMVKRGTRLGRVGNSGQSPGPHLHFQLMEGPHPFIDQGLPVRFSHFSAGGQFFTRPTSIPTRMIVFGPTQSDEANE